MRLLSAILFHDNTRRLENLLLPPPRRKSSGKERERVNARTYKKCLSGFLLNGNWEKRTLVTLSLSYLSHSARRDDKNTNVALLYLRALFFEPKSAREERRKRESKRARRTVCPFSVFS